MSGAAGVNTLLYASDRDSPFHDRAVQFLTDRATTLDLLCLAWPTITGYLRIATHPGIFARPLSAAEAMRNVNALVSLPHVRLLAEEEGFWDVYQDVVRHWPARGNQVPDARVMRALAAFGAPVQDIIEADFAKPGVTYQIGVVPGRIDILTELTGLTFVEAWPDRVRRPFGEVDVDFIGRDAFIRNKRATGRPKDLGDIEGLE